MPTIKINSPAGKTMSCLPSPSLNNHLGVSENVVYPEKPMVLLISIPMKNGYFIGNINPTFSDKPIFIGAMFKSFPVMGAITNHPSFKTSAFITVMLAYLYQTSEEPGTKNRDRHPAPPLVIWLVFKKRKPNGYDMVLDGFIWFFNVFHMVSYGFIWFYMVLSCYI